LGNVRNATTQGKSQHSLPFYLHVSGNKLMKHSVYPTAQSVINKERKKDKEVPSSSHHMDEFKRRMTAQHFPKITFQICRNWSRSHYGTTVINVDYIHGEIRKNQVNACYH
jgi:hypothetical protein